ncbi:MAG: dimethyl sulfoxide reductase anchor subunit [Syntrophomonadaceae bacterium]|nr:dimethyl sulfoxide reductase anchor subunit [Syntrophomonadaceae bacterium]
MGETSLLIFSISIQAAVGIMIFAFIGEMLYKDQKFKTAALAAAILGAIGIIASLMHLGHPLSAINVLSRFGNSWLSTEAVLSGIFAGIVILYALVLYLKSENKNLSLALSGIGGFLGLIVIFSMAKVYTTTSVSIWQGVNTFVDFYATTVVLGALFFLASSIKQLKEIDKKIFLYSILAAVVLQAASSMPHILGLNEMGLAAQNSVHILNNFTVLVWAKWLLILGGAGLALILLSANQSSKKANVNAFYTAGVALLFGQVIGRYLFYAAMVVINVGLV